MSVQSKTALQSTINSQITTNGVGSITGAQVNAILDNMVDSYEDFIGSYTTVQIAALVGMTTRQIVYDTTLGEYYYYNGILWTPFCCTRSASLSITSAQILALNSTPLTIVAAPGAGKYLIADSAEFVAVYGTTPYATYDSLQIITDTATMPQLDTFEGLDFSVSTFRKLKQYSSVNPATATQIIENKALKVTVYGGNPTAGDSTIIVHLKYRIFTP